MFLPYCREPCLIFGLKSVEPFDEPLSEEASHLYVVDVVEGRIKLAIVVLHLQKVVYVDDIFLVYLSEILVKFENLVVCDATFQFDGLFPSGHYHLP